MTTQRKNKELNAPLDEISEMRKTGFWKEITRYRELQANVNKIMKYQFENMKTIYFSHSMTKFNTPIEDECLKMIKEKLPGVKIINPNSNEYKWKKERSPEWNGSAYIDDQQDAHSVDEWGNGWHKFADSMIHYCNLVSQSDGLIYLPNFDYNTRKNAVKKYIVEITRGVKVEISYATKLGIPTISFINPDEMKDFCPTDIYIPNYMIDRINAKVDNGKIINSTTGKVLGKVEGNTITDLNGKIAGIIMSPQPIPTLAERMQQYRKTNNNEDTNTDKEEENSYGNF